MRPPIKWAGGKRRILHRVQEYISKSGKVEGFAELFAGSAALSFLLEFNKVWLNDSNEALINFFMHLKLSNVTLEKVEIDKSIYLEKRKRFNDIKVRNFNTLNTVEKAEYANLFLYLLKFCFNGLYRENKKGEFNTPFGGSPTFNITPEYVSECSNLMQNWNLLCENWETAILKVPSDYFLYVDPPYYYENTKNFSQYQSYVWNLDAHIALAKSIKEYKGSVLASNIAHPELLRVYEELGFEIVTFNAPRFIACNGDRSPALEMLAWKS